MKSNTVRQAVENALTNVNLQLYAIDIFKASGIQIVDPKTNRDGDQILADLKREQTTLQKQLDDLKGNKDATTK